MKKELQIPEDKKIINTKELQKLGFSYYKINKFVEEGKLNRLNKSNYENCNFNGEVSDLIYVYQTGQHSIYITSRKNVMKLEFLSNGQEKIDLRFMTLKKRW